MEQIGRKQNLVKILVALGIVALGVGLLAGSATVAQGIRDGLIVCGKVLIPSLFPFMALSGFVAITDYAAILSAPLRPITTKIYKLPPDLGVVVLLSLIGGFPVGARMISTLLSEGKITKETAQRMLCFCVNSGPSFLITAVGTGMFFSRGLGIILFATQTAATLLVGAAVSFRATPQKPVGRSSPSLKGGEAFVTAVTGASSAMIAMCAFAVLFSGILAMVRGSGLVEFLARLLPLSPPTVEAVLCGFFEVTAGCLAAVKVGGDGAILLVSACVSFTGLSVLFQIMSNFKDNPIRYRPLILSRLAHGVLSGAMALPLYRLFCSGGQQVWLPVSPPMMHTDDRTLVISVCLLAMCSILVLSMEDRNK